MSSREDILAELQRSRQAIARDLAAVRARCDIPARARSSFQKRPLVWLGSALAVGWLIAGKKRRGASARKQRSGKAAASFSQKSGSRNLTGFLLGLLKLLIPLLKPALTAYAARRMEELGGRFGR